MGDIGASAAIPTTPAEILAAAQACLAAGDIPAFDRHIDRLLRIAPHWYEALLLAAASFEPRDVPRAETLYRRALRNRPGAVEPAAGLVRCRLAANAPIPFAELALMAQVPPVPDAVATVRRLAAAYGWRATGFIAQAGQSLTGMLLLPPAEGAPPLRLVLRPVEDSPAASLTDLLSEAPATGPDVPCAFAYDQGEGDGIWNFRSAAPGAGRYLAILVDDANAPLGCLLPVITVREVDAVIGEVWWSHGGVIAGWVESENGTVPQIEVTSDPLARPLAQTVSPLAYAGDDVPAGKHLFGFAVVLPLESTRRTIDIRVKGSGSSLRGAPLRVEGRQGLALTPALHSFEIEPPDWHLLPRIQRSFRASARSATIDVIVPVYRNLEKTRRCIESVLAVKTRATAHLVVVNDRSPSPAVTRYVQSLAARGVTVIENPVNLGFSGAVNVGIRRHLDRDVVLLNADTEVADGWLDRIVAAAQESPDIATVTPLSNNATILSYPTVHAVNPFLSGVALAQMDQVIARGRAVPLEIPTAVGFCMFIRRACLDDCGDFDEVNFGRGYGEENEFCLRASARGWRHVCAPNVLVAHDGGVSFAGQHNAVQQRRLNALQNTFKGYERLIQRFVHADPLLPVRRAADIRRLSESRAPTFVMVMPELGGGTSRHVDDLCRALETEGVQCLIWSSVKNTAAGEMAVRIRRWREPMSEDAAPDASTLDPFPNMIYALPFEARELRDALAGLDLRHVHVHHFLDLPWDAVELATQLGVPYDVSIHDYSWACPRVTMVGPSQRYCGEPDIAGCNACVAVAGDRTGSKLDVAALRARSSTLLAHARKVFVPNVDVKDRLVRYFPGAPFVVRAHPFAAKSVPRVVAQAGTIAIVGAINVDKGYDVLLACAQDAAERKLPLRFAVIGFTQDDAPLLRTGLVSITGRYQEGEAAELLAASGAIVGWVPSVCPETWSYALSQLLASGLMPVAFDLGAPAARIRAMGRGALLPLNLHPRDINDALVKLTRDNHDPDSTRTDPGRYPHMRADYYDLPQGLGPPMRSTMSARRNDRLLPSRVSDSDGFRRPAAGPDIFSHPSLEA